jgi:hypothetical protein
MFKNDKHFQRIEELTTTAGDPGFESKTAFRKKEPGEEFDIDYSGEEGTGDEREDSDGKKPSNFGAGNKALKEAIELVHVYDDDKHKKMYGTGEIVKGKDKKIKGVLHNLIRFDGTTEKYFPATRVALAENVIKKALHEAVFGSLIRQRFLHEAKGIGVELSLRDAREGLEILRDEFKRHVKYKMKASNYIVFKNKNDGEDFMDRMEEAGVEIYGAYPENYFDI